MVRILASQLADLILARKHAGSPGSIPGLGTLSHLYDGSGLIVKRFTTRDSDFLDKTSHVSSIDYSRSLGSTPSKTSF